MLLTGLVIAALTMPAGATFLVDQRVSGSWYHEAHEGEGFALEVLADGGAVVYWFTYDDAGSQRWFIGHGEVSGDRIEFDALLSPRGPLFGDDFDPGQLALNNVGSASFRFSGCDAGEVSFEVAGFSATWPLTRITRLDGMACPTGQASTVAGLSGSFYPPAHDGEGYVVQVLTPDSALVYWFTFDARGDPMWLLGVARDQDSVWVIDDLLRPRGASFGQGFAPDDVISEPWGELSLELDCEQGSATYVAEDPALGSGVLDLNRLTRFGLVDCQALLAGHDPPPPATPVCGDQARTHLGRFPLLNATQLSPVDNDQFLPAVDCGAPLQALNGTLWIEGGPLMLSGVDSNLFGYPGMRVFPRVSLRLVSDGSRLVPVDADVLRSETGSSYWNLLVSPGQVWSEAGDGGWSRASFPFALINDYYNETHNGVATFLYKGQSVTGLRFQVGQELAPWNRGNYWGQIPMQWSGQPVAEAERAAALADDRATRRLDLPVRPLGDLMAVADSGAFAAFTRALPDLDISAGAVVLDGVLYVDEVSTRFGAHPYPRQMRMAAFSVTKSASAALALLHLAQRYGAEVMDYRIAEYLTVTADHNGWDDVTFAHAINMATGIGDANPDPGNSLFADENDPNNPNFGQWAIVGSRRAKLDLSFSYGELPWGPGEVVRYNTMHTFVLAAAMDALVKQREGPDVDLWTLIEKDVLRPIGITHLPTMHTIEGDGSRGVPLGGVGLYPNVQDIAKIALLFDREGRWHGQQLLDGELTRRALYRHAPGTPNPGLRAARHYQIQSGVWTPAFFNMSFWGVNFAPGEACAPVIPSMEGFGGNMVLVPPNGVITFRFADGDVYDPGALALTSDRLRSFCGQ